MKLKLRVAGLVNYFVMSAIGNTWTRAGYHSPYSTAAASTIQAENQKFQLG
jgi:hypothetical protein